MKHGLKRVVKTVRGKHGSYRRAYSVRSDTGGMSTKQWMRKHGKTWAGTQFATGAIGGAAGHVALRRGLTHSRNRGSFSAILGYGVGAVGSAKVLSTHKRVRQAATDYSRLGLGGRAFVQAAGIVPHIAGIAVGGAVARKVIHAFGGRGVRQMAPLRPRTLGRAQ